MKTILLIAVLVLAVLTKSLVEPPRKHNAGLPTHFSEHRIPEPAKILEKSAVLNIHLKEGEVSLMNPSYKKVIFEVDIPVDSASPLQIAFANPMEDVLDISLRTPSGYFVPLKKYEIKENFPVGGDKSVPVETYLINDIQETGYYGLKVESTTFLAPCKLNHVLNNNVPDAVVIVQNYDNIEIESSVTNYMFKVGKKMGLHAQILKDGVRMSESNDGSIVISAADMIVTSPNGKESDVPMHDDGLFGDKIKGDHIFTAEINSAEPGVYHLSAVIKGHINDGTGSSRPFLKTTEHTFVVADKNFELNGKASLAKINNDNQRVNINIGVTLDSEIQASQLGKYRAYTEVYGVSKQDKSVQAAAWIGSMVNVENGHVSLEFNLNWLAHSNLQGPLTLKNTYIAEAGSSYPITKFDADIVVDHSLIQFDKNYAKVMTLSGPLSITHEMKHGVNPLKNQVNETSGPSLVLLHGYCSGDNPFEKNSHVFSNAAYFLNKNANENNDNFAVKVHNFAQEKGSSRYSLIGHSQGGMVSLHLLNYYWTGLDNTPSGRRIQSVGTPWQGCTAAGSAANLGKAFGVGCGTNNDLSLDGSKNWLSGIHEDHPEQVYFYTTSYKTGNLFGDYCNMAINMILQWPNDGTSEKKYSTLVGGNFVNNVEKQCHTTGMKYEAQYLDNNRNTEMNNAAAR